MYPVSASASDTHGSESRDETRNGVDRLRRDAFAMCRTLLMDLGMLSWGAETSLFGLEKSKRLVRELKHLDTAGGVREQHKIAVVYIGQHHRSKEDIVTASRTSAAFEGFLAQLGWAVNLDEHKGYNGRVKSSEFPGCVLPYYATPALEVLFHVTTRMHPCALPAAGAKDTDEGVAPRVLRADGADLDEDARKRVYKARWVHVGNDSVHVVWCEQEREFRPEIFPTQFAEVTIVVYPMTNGLFRVQIFNKAQVRVAPLFHGAVVDVRALPVLVRQTAVAAGVALRRSVTRKQFISTRLESIHKIRTKLRVDQSFEDLNAAIILPSLSPTPQTNTAQKAVS